MGFSGKSTVERPSVVARHKRVVGAKPEKGTSRSRLAALVLTVVLCVTSISSVYVSAPQDDPYYNDSFGAVIDPNQYQHVADAILEGHAYLSIDPPQWLIESDNPYDYGFRIHEGQSTGQPYLWDYAFFDGKYYSYFGILPVVLLFLPAKVLLGISLSNEVAMSLLACFATAASVFLGFMLLKRFRPSAKNAEKVLASTALWLCSCVVWLSFLPSFYHEAIIAGLACAETGIAAWLLADEGERIRRAPLAIGSLLVGLTVLARPFLILCALLAFPVFGHRFIKQGLSQKEFFALNSEAVVNTLLVIVPIALCSFAAMWWNVQRFGSPFDFGYKYNLTGFDMMHKAFSRRRLVFSMFMYVFAPLNLLPNFPFFSNNYSVHGWYQSLTTTVPELIQEPFYGGVLAFFPFVLLLVLFVDRSTRVVAKQKHANWLVVTSLLLALAMIAFDSSTAITQRYLADFTWLICASAIVCYCCFESAHENEAASVGVKAVFVVLVVCSFVLVMVNLLAPDRYNPILLGNPSLYHGLSEALGWIHL